jgi:hypothetical protein
MLALLFVARDFWSTPSSFYLSSLLTTSSPFPFSFFTFIATSFPPFFTPKGSLSISCHSFNPFLFKKTFSP